MTVIVYEGQGQPQAGSATGLPVTTAAELAAADIVLTTYDVLRRDVWHQPDAEAKTHSLRRRKKYEVGICLVLCAL